MRIAILGWGSLLWDENRNKRFDLVHEPWLEDGPSLKLEFSRISKSRHRILTLVIDPEHGSTVIVKWCVSKRSNPEDAICDLRCREGTTLDNLGWVFAEQNRDQCRDPESLNKIREWSATKQVDIAIWTDLSSNFLDVRAKPFSTEEAVNYIKGLSPEAKSKAAEYVWRAPECVDTPLRRALQQPPWFVETPMP